MTNSIDVKNMICSVFSLDPEHIEECSCFDRAQSLIIDIKMNDERPACPDCGNRTVKIKGYVIKKINHSLMAHKECLIQYHARRYVCPVCHRTYYERNPFVFHKMKISSQVVLQILKDLQSPSETFKQVAARYHLSPTSCASIFDMIVDIPRACLPEVLSIDENYAFHSKTENSKYVCLFINQVSGQPIDLLPSRRIEYLEKYFRPIPDYERKRVRYVATDMYEPYRLIIKKFLPNSVHIVDHYHIAQELHRRLDSIRLRIMKPLRCINTNKRTYEQEENYYILKHHNYYLFKHFERAKTKDGKYLFDVNLTRSYNKKLKRYMNPYDYAMKLISIHPDLEKAWKLKDEITDFYRSATLETAPKEIENIIQDLLNSEINELIRFGYTMINWKKEIINSFTINRTVYNVSKKTGKVSVEYKKINNAKIERANSTIKSITKAANGYTNWNRFRNRVMLILEKGIEFEIDEKDGQVKMVAKKEPEK